MFLLAHISDPHLGPEPVLRWRDVRVKRLIGYVNWRRRHRFVFRPGVLEAVLADIRAARPDHIAVTGDLVNLGLDVEFTKARGWLAELGEPEDVTVIPGNHDVYVRGSFEELGRAWGDFMIGDGANSIALPSVRRRGRLAIVSVSTGIPTPPFMATGRIGPEQAEALVQQLRALAGEALFRVVLIHHPPIAYSTPSHKRLIDGDLFRAAIAKAGAELILHGHNHVTSVASLPGPNGPVPVVGAASASILPRRGQNGGAWNLFRIGQEDGRFVCEMRERGIAKPGGEVKTLSEHRFSAPAQIGTLTQA